ncbi:MAG: hydroxymethylbilane synthase [Porticoccaceae bacterium]|nr:hydroxymethylbilane synthase [Porticoccaceae bacterium]
MSENIADSPLLASADTALIRIATRKSDLALWQAHFVKTELERLHGSAVKVEILGFTTRGDKILDTPLAKIGGKGLFIKELETALLENRADIAVHSMKDVPMAFPHGLELAVICERGNPHDALVSNNYDSVEDLPPGARVGTCSLRRSCQLQARFPQLEIIDLRGNVNTRLAKLDSGHYDAIVLAAAGLIRLGLAERIAQQLDTELSLPAGGQGAVGIECRVGDSQTQTLLAPLQHRSSALRVVAERAVNERLQGGCQAPIACFAELEGEVLQLRALVGSLDGTEILRERIEGPAENGAALGVEVAERLLSKGADRLLAEIR